MAKGSIISFFSFKGGVGRTMALANVAVLAAKMQHTSEGHRVLMIDWDLEAPGLNRYFQSYCSEDDVESHEGIADVFQSKCAKSETFNRDHLLARLFKSVISTSFPGLDILQAGSTKFDLSPISWGSIIEKDPLFFQVLSQQLTEKYSAVFIDSRTGVTDTSSVCSALLPDKLVAVFTPSRQSIDGLVSILKEAALYRLSSMDLRPLVIYPLVSRVEIGEYDLRTQWRFGENGYQHIFENLFSELYRLDSCNLGPYFDEVLIQSHPYFAYGEQLAVAQTQNKDRLSLSRSYELFAERLLFTRYPWEDVSVIAYRDPGRALLERTRNLFQEGQMTMAAYCASLAASSRQEYFFSGHPLVAEALLREAAIRLEIGEFEHSRTLLLAAYRIYKLTKGRESLECADVLILFARVYLRKAQFNRAEVLCKNSMRIRQKHLGAFHPSVAECYIELAQLSLHLGDANNAGQYLSKTQQIIDDFVAEETLEKARILVLVAEQRTAMGMINDAENYLNRASRIIITLAKHDHPLKCACTLLLSRVLLLKGEPRKALGLIGETVGAEFCDDDSYERSIDEMLTKAEILKSLHAYWSAKTIFEKVLLQLKAERDSRMVPDLRFLSASLSLSEMFPEIDTVTDVVRSPSVGTLFGLRKLISLARERFYRGDCRNAIPYLREASKHIDAFEDKNPLDSFFCHLAVAETQLEMGYGELVDIEERIRRLDVLQRKLDQIPLVITHFYRLLSRMKFEIAYDLDNAVICIEEAIRLSRAALSGLGQSKSDQSSILVECLIDQVFYMLENDFLMEPIKLLESIDSYQVDGVVGDRTRGRKGLAEALMLYSLGEHDECIRRMEQYSSIGCSPIDRYYFAFHKARIFHRTGDSQSAEELLSSVVTSTQGECLIPNVIHLKSLYVRVLVLNGRIDEAAREYEKLREDYPKKIQMRESIELELLLCEFYLQCANYYSSDCLEHYYLAKKKGESHFRPQHSFFLYLAIDIFRILGSDAARSILRDSIRDAWCWANIQNRSISRAIFTAMSYGAGEIAEFDVKRLTGCGERELQIVWHQIAELSQRSGLVSLAFSLLAKAKAIDLKIEPDDALRYSRLLYDFACLCKLMRKNRKAVETFELAFKFRLDGVLARTESKFHWGDSKVVEFAPILNNLYDCTKDPALVLEKISRINALGDMRIGIDRNDVDLIQVNMKDKVLQKKNYDLTSEFDDRVWRKELATAPTNLRLRLEYAKRCLDIGAVRDSMQISKSLLKEESSDFEIISESNYLIALCYLRSGHLVLSKDFAQKALPARETQASLCLAQVMLRWQDYKSALVILESFGAQIRELPGGCATFSHILSSLDEPELAAEMLLMERDRRSVEFHLAKARHLAYELFVLLSNYSDLVREKEVEQARGLRWEIEKGRREVENVYSIAIQRFPKEPFIFTERAHFYLADQWHSYRIFEGADVWGRGISDLRRAAMLHVNEFTCGFTTSRPD